ncbi:MAG TPA: hypothetical protein VL400_27620, partial [Polyangiaceae bacterium]|nr:hypothetical protein [Polyangiaceae bacterium]
MKIVAARLHGWGGEARVASATRRWDARRGLVLRLVDSEGRVGLGEACPLAGMSVDGLEDARAALGALDVTALDRRLESVSGGAPVLA